MSYLDQITVGSTTYDLQDSGAQRVTLTGTSAPTTSTVGVVGQHYINTTATGHPYEYVCTAVSSGTYTWIPVDASEAPVTSVNSKTGAVVLDKTDIGLGNVANVAQYSASNPPPYPVTSVNGSTGAVTVSVPSAATAAPSDLGTAAVGTSTKWAKEDHVHNYPDIVHVGSTAPTDSNIELWLDNSSGGGSIVSSVDGKTGVVTVLPSGGTTGQVLKKVSNTSYDVAWANESGIRPNLLDNWYFVGGGSQKGAGYFPINSKGQTVYTTANAMCIDRWTAATTSVTLRGWGMEIQSSNSNENVTQVLDGGFDAFAGKTLTLSAIVNDQLLSETFTVGTTQPSAYTMYANITTISKLAVRFVFATNPNACRMQFVCSNSAGITYTVKAVKLELGDSQTLAHQVNGSWVLNEVPNYKEAQVRCGVYTPTYQRGESVNLGGLILVGTKLSSGVVVCSLVLPKAVPSSLTITNTLAVGWVRGNGDGDSSGLSVASVTRASDNVIQIGVSGSTIATLQAAVVNISSGSISFS